MAWWSEIWRPKLQTHVYIVHYRDINNKQHNLTTYSEKERDELIAQLDDEPGVDPKTLFGPYALQWLAVKRPTFRSQTYRTYRSKINAHIDPLLGAYRLRDIKRSMLRKFLSSRLEAGQAPASVQALNLLLTQIFDQAVEDGLIHHNPATKLSKTMNLGRLQRSLPEKVKSLTESERDKFLMTAKGTDPELFPLFYMMARTGMRPGEAAALQWKDIDFDLRRIHVERSAASKLIYSTKTGEDRFVDMSSGLKSALLRWRAERSAEKIRKGWPEMPPWLFLNRRRTHYLPSELPHRFKKILEKAELPMHHTPKSLRHSFARIHLEKGADMVWLQRQLGHKTISITLDLYGKYAQIHSLMTADRIDGSNGQGDLF